MEYIHPKLESVHIKNESKKQNQSYNRKIDSIKSVITSKNFAKAFNTKGKPFNFVATFIKFRIIMPRQFFLRMDNRNKPSLKCESSCLIVFVSTVHRQIASCLTIKQLNKFSAFWSAS